MYTKSDNYYGLRWLKKEGSEKMYYIIKVKKKGLADYYSKTSTLHIARAMKKEAEELKGGSYGIFNRLE